MTYKSHFLFLNILGVKVQILTSAAIRFAVKIE